MNTRVHPERVDQLVSAVASCWALYVGVVAGSNPTHALFVENAIEQKL